MTDKIVIDGDIVAGSKVFNVGLGLNGSRWFNRAGQVVFLANDANGIGLYATASATAPPPPASTVIEWLGPANPPAGTPPNGSFTDASAWKPLNGDPPRVPAKTDTLNDTALFDRAEEYTVTLGIQHAEQMIVKNGHVIFENGGGIKVDALSFDNPSAIIDNARMTLSGPNAPAVSPTLTSNHALIGASGAARVDVSGAEWDCLGSLRIGGPGEGTLTIDSFGEVTSGESRIGGSGSGHVNIGTNGVWTTGNLAIGIDGGLGELTIQDGGKVNSDRAVIGQEPSVGNNVIVQGGDTSPSTWHPLSLSVGANGSGQLTVRDGGLVTVDVSLSVAEEPSGRGTVTVSGVNASALSSKITAEQMSVGEAGDGELKIEDGGVVETLSLAISGFQGGRGKVTVQGVSGTLIPSTLAADELSVGSQFRAASMLVEGRAEVRSGIATIRSPNVLAATEVSIIGSLASWKIDNRLIVGIDGVAPPGQSIVTLGGGLLSADSVVVNTNGVIRGSGTLAVAPANRFTNDNGTISPGLSPGTLTILGGYEQHANGRLLIEIGGTNSADYDHLVVTNGATLDGNVTFKFINGFAPKTGDHFDFLSVGGELSGAFATVGLQNLAPGFQFTFVTNGSLLCMTALNNGVFDPTLPGQVNVTLTNVGGLTYATYVLTTSNTGQRITLDGDLTQTSNVFSQAFQGTTFIGGGCINQTDSVTNTVLLGALTPGAYSFRILVNTQAVQTVAFTVPPNVSKTLLAARRLPDGGVEFQIAGLSPTAYTIEASEDLQNWFELGSGTLPTTFTDPDAAIFRTRFYRARIGP